MKKFDTKDFLDFEEKYTNMLSGLGFKFDGGWTSETGLNVLNLNYILEIEEAYKPLIEVKITKDEKGETASIFFNITGYDNLYHIPAEKLVDVLKPIIDKIRR